MLVKLVMSLLFPMRPLEEKPEECQIFGISREEWSKRIGILIV